MPDGNVHENVTEAIFAYVKATNTILGPVVLSFLRAPSKSTLTHTIISKGLVPEPDIWNGNASTIQGCSRARSKQRPSAFRRLSRRDSFARSARESLADSPRKSPSVPAGQAGRERPLGTTPRRVRGLRRRVAHALVHHRHSARAAENAALFGVCRTGASSRASDEQSARRGSHHC